MFGEQKGEKSPFFHIKKDDKWKDILLSESESSLFASEKDADKIRTFFHEEKRTRFLEHAKKALAERQKIAKQTANHAQNLAADLLALAHALSVPPKSTEDLTHHCAELALVGAEASKKISKNILVPLNKTIIKQSNDSTFFQVQKDLAFAEAALTALDALPADWDATKATLSAQEPQALAALASDVLVLYENTERFLTDALTDAAKAAKQTDTVRYQASLRRAVLLLFETANRLRATQKGE